MWMAAVEIHANSCLLEPVYTGTQTRTRVYVNAALCTARWIQGLQTEYASIHARMLNFLLFAGFFSYLMSVRINSGFPPSDGFFILRWHVHEICNNIAHCSQTAVLCCHLANTNEWFRILPNYSGSCYVWIQLLQLIQSFISLFRRWHASTTLYIKKNMSISSLPICGPQQPFDYKAWLSCSSESTRWRSGMSMNSRSDWLKSGAEHYPGFPLFCLRQQ